MNTRAFEKARLAIDGLLLRSTERPLLVAIDGRCGSGKSTLGEMLSEHYGCTLFHMDDFFLRAVQRTPERLAAPGENVDHERFTEEILLPLRRGEPVFLRKIIHGLFEPGEPESVSITPLVIVEGSYSCHEKLRDFYDLRLFLTVSPECQLRRILERNGPESYSLFVSRWIPMEEQYIRAMQPEAFCELLLTTEEE